MRKILRVTLLIFGVLLIIFAIAGFWLNYNSADWLGEKLEQAVLEKTHGRYQLEIDSVSLNSYTFSLKMMGLALTRDTSVGNPSGISFLDHYDVEVKLEHFYLGYFQLWDFLQNGRLEVGRLEFMRPEISIRELSQVLVDTLQPDSGSLKTLVDTTKKSAPTVEIGRFEIKEGNMYFYEAGRRRPLLTLEGISTHIRKLHSEADEPISTNGFTLELTGITAWVDNYLARIQVYGFKLTRENMKVDTFDFRYMCAKSAIGPLKGFQTDWLAIMIQDLEVKGLDLRGFVRDSVLMVDNMVLGNLYVNAYRDQSYERQNMKTKPFPADLVRAIPVPLYIKEMEVKGGEILVENKSPKMLVAGGLPLENLRAKVTNVTNIPERLAEDPFMKWEGKLKLAGEGEIKVEIRFHLDRSDNLHYVKGSLGEMDFSALNGFLASQALLEFKSGRIKRFDFNFQADNHNSEGELDLEYTGLRIQKLENYEDYVEANPRMGALVFLGNVLVRDDYLHSHRDFKKGKIYFERQLHKAVFSYWVKSLMSGMVSSLGFGPKDPAAASDKKTERKQRREERKKSRQQKE